MPVPHLRVSFEDATLRWSDQCAYPLCHAKDTFLTWRHVSRWKGYKQPRSCSRCRDLETLEPALRTNDRQGR